jgi:hypothetical protein
MRRENKSKKVTTKIDPLPGHLEEKYVSCGRPNCCCAKGKLHGPYFYRRWEKHCHRHTKYVRKGEVLTIKKRISAFKCNKDERRQARNTNRQLIREIREQSKSVELILKLIRQGAIKL